MTALVIAAAIWAALGLGLYHIAARSWLRRWPNSQPPLSYAIGALLGPCALGAVIAELTGPRS